MPGEKNKNKNRQRLGRDTLNTCKMSKSISLTMPYYKVTGRRHRVSPCRSAYFASPWWLLTLDRWRRSREAALLFPESWLHLTMRGSNPSLFMIIPNSKRHPNNTKTDQLPISEVITGLPRPYHNAMPSQTNTPTYTHQGGNNIFFF